MRERNIKKQFWLSKEEAYFLSTKSNKVGLSESELIRNLIIGYEPKEKPPQEFYEVIKQLRMIGNNLNQIAKVANTINKINKDLYDIEVTKLNNIILNIKKTYLLPDKK